VEQSWGQSGGQSGAGLRGAKKAFCFQQWIDRAKLADYVQVHKHVPKQVQQGFAQAGRTNFSLFYRPDGLVVRMECDSQHFAYNSQHFAYNSQHFAKSHSTLHSFHSIPHAIHSISQKVTAFRMQFTAFRKKSQHFAHLSQHFAYTFYSISQKVAAFL
jgi:L-rhamnose mutarotase